MGAGQIGGIASLLDMDFNNAAGFYGVKSDYSEGQFVTYYLSHALLFCLGALIEPHVVITPALCVFGEKYKFDVFAGTHKFLIYAGDHRKAQHLSLHKGYNHTQRWTECSPHNLGLIVLDKAFSFHEREPHSEYVISRLRYGPRPHLPLDSRRKCHYFGFGSRRNGFLLPLLIHMRKVEVVVLSSDRCLPIWDNENQFLCIQQVPCKDDVGSIIECSGFAVGMMVSRIIDRPCGVGFLDLQKNLKFITCGVDDAKDVIAHDNYLSFDMGNLLLAPSTPEVIIISTPEENGDPPVNPTHSSMEEEEEEDTPAEVSKFKVRKLSSTKKPTVTDPLPPVHSEESSSTHSTVRGFPVPTIWKLLQNTTTHREGNAPLYLKPMDYYGYL